MRAYAKKDVDRKALKGARIAIVGYGSQGRAHALNLKDSGHDVIVGVRRGGDSWKKARKDGLAVAEPADAVRGAALVALLTPDMAQPGVYKDIRKTIERGAALLFAHGFNVHFKQIRPRKDLDVVLIAPKGPGDLVRRQFQQGRGVPCLIAVGQDATGTAHARALCCYPPAAPFDSADRTAMEIRDVALSPATAARRSVLLLRLPALLPIGRCGDG